MAKARHLVCCHRAIDVDGKPTVAFETASLSEARTISAEFWVWVDVISATSNGAQLWDGKAELIVRPAQANEMSLFWQAQDRLPKCLLLTWSRSTSESERCRHFASLALAGATKCTSSLCAEVISFLRQLRRAITQSKRPDLLIAVIAGTVAWCVTTLLRAVIGPNF